MQICESVNQKNPLVKSSIALGYFDGIHKGHRAVIQNAVNFAEQNQMQPAVFTFELPAQNSLKGKQLLSWDEKQKRLEHLGVKYCYKPLFAQIQQMTPRQFVEEYLKETCGAKAVFCGENFTFGKEKSGNIALLKELCLQNNIHLQVVPMAQVKGQPVSSTRIRSLLLDGDIETANLLLEEPYCIDYPVQHGAGNGNVWGFPTINQIFPKEALIPKQGVYITSAQLQDGTRLAGATGLGTRPTVGGEGVTCETFFPNYHGDLYGQTVRVEFFKYLKPVVKFESIDQLKEYVFDAAQAALDYFK